jgi:raffinose/stachyose/melibiose transport system substrate-binding protein
MSKKILVLGIVLVMTFTMVLSGCSSKVSKKDDDNKTNSTVSEGETKKNPDNKKKTIELRLLSRFSGAEALAPIWQDAQAEFMEKYPNVKFVDESVSDQSAYDSKFKTGLATGDLPAVFRVAGTLVQAEYAKSGLLHDFSQDIAGDTEWSKELNQGALNEAKFDSYGVKGVYALPVSSQVEVMFYNTELFKKAGIEKAPETYEELLTAIDKLKAAGITPWGVGGKSNWQVGHIFNVLLYKNLGVEAAKDLGFNRNKKWTDPEVVDVLEEMKRLADSNVFTPNLAGVQYETVKQDFLDGKTAMIFNGTWFVKEAEGAAIVDKIQTFLFPSIESKPEFKDHNIMFPNNLCVNGKLSEEETKYAVEFLKLFTSKQYQQRVIYEAQQLPARNDIEIDATKMGPLSKQIYEYTPLIGVGGSDTFNYDPLVSMKDRTRNSLVGLLLEYTPEEAAKEIQNEVDSQ